jgi:hypothetical protein
MQVSGHEDPNIRTPSYDRKLPDIPNDPNEVYKNSVKVGAILKKLKVSDKMK